MFASRKQCSIEKATCDPLKSSNLARNFTVRNCMCDPQCATYGDCCVDSPYFKDAEQRRAGTLFNCMPNDAGDFYMKQSCPASWKHLDVRRKCEKSVSNNMKDPLLMTPVTDRLHNITYGNIFCALCNGHPIGSKNQDVWKIGFRCPNHSPLSGKDEHELLERFSYNESVNFWQIVEHNQTISCSFNLVIPDAAKPRLVPCLRNMIKTCPATWIHGQHSRNTSALANQPSRESIRDSCELYTMAVYSASTDPISYRNVHCAMCNSIQIQNVVCENPLMSRWAGIVPPDVPSLTILFDFSSIMHTKNCGPGRIYDGLLKTCRQDIDVGRLLGSNLVPNCSSSMTVVTDFVFAENNVYVPGHNRTYGIGQYVYHYENRSVAVCGSQDKVVQYPIYFRMISAVGIGVSVVCLVAHLVAFVLLKDLRNLSGKNLASLCLALLMAYTSFALANALESTVCLVNAVLTYYFFLAAFSWMLIMSFDVWRSLKIATKELRVSSGKQWRKFFIYSACGWLVPAKFVLVALLVDLCPMGEVGQRFQPNFGRDACWFNNGQALLLFFILPVFVTLLCNVSFFIFSAVMIYSSHSMTRYSASPATKRDFRLYARLSLIMGMTWITGLVAGVANNTAMWILFILSNAFLGLFIFLAFTWRKAVLHGLKNLKRDSVLNLPAFSWSANSSSSIETTGKSQARDEKRTSNTYY